MTSLRFEKTETHPVYSRSLRDLAARAAGLVKGRRTPVLMTPGVGPAGVPDGVTRADAIDQFQWEALYERMLAGAEDGALPPLADLHARSRAAGAEGVTPIAMLDIAFSRPSRGLTRAILQARRQDAAIAEPEGPLEAQFETGGAFAACGLLAPAYHGFERSPDVHRGVEVRLRLDPDLWIGNRPRPDRVEIDLCDGEGFRDLAWGAVIPVTFDSETEGRFVLRAHYEDGPRTAGFLMTVEAPFAQPLTPEGVSPAGGPHRSQRIPAAIAHGGTYYEGTCHIYNAGGSGPLKRPILVAEGFPGGNHPDVIYDIFNGKTPDGWGRDAQLADELRRRGYDVVVLTFSTVGAPIQGNAFVYLAALQWMWSDMGYKGEIVAAGGSMGGLIARYALTYAEFAKPQVPLPYVRALLTFDSPHRGANVPVAVQYAARFFGMDWARDNNVMLNHACAKQMLIHQVWHRVETEPVTKPQFTGFYAELEGLGNGGYPTKPKYAVSNGSRDGAWVSLPESKAMRMWRNHWPGQHYEVILYCSANRVLTAKYAYAECYFSDFNERIIASLEGGTFHSRDGCAGGFTGHFEAVRNALNRPCSNPGIEMVNGRNCFVPAYSALGVAFEGDAYRFKASELAPGQSPFTDWYAPASNQWHCTVDKGIKTWVLDKLFPVAAGVEAALEGVG